MFFLPNQEKYYTCIRSTAYYNDNEILPIVAQIHNKNFTIRW